jgi:hypothetical protein
VRGGRKVIGRWRGRYQASGVHRRGVVTLGEEQTLLRSLHEICGVGTGPCGPARIRRARCHAGHGWRLRTDPPGPLPRRARMPEPHGSAAPAPTPSTDAGTARRPVPRRRPAGASMLAPARPTVTPAATELRRTASPAYHWAAGRAGHGRQRSVTDDAVCEDERAPQSGHAPAGSAGRARRTRPSLRTASPPGSWPRARRPRIPRTAV